METTNGAPDVISDVDTLARLRRILRLLGLENAVPADDAALGGVLFPVFGQIASAIERGNRAPAVAWKTTHRAVCVPLTEDREIADQWRDNGYPVTEFFTRPAITSTPAAKPARWPDEATMKFALGAANALGAISMAQVEAIVRAVLPLPDDERAGSPVNWPNSSADSRDAATDRCAKCGISPDSLVASCTAEACPIFSRGSAADTPGAPA